MNKDSKAGRDASVQAREAEVRERERTVEWLKERVKFLRSEPGHAKAREAADVVEGLAECLSRGTHWYPYTWGGDQS